MKELKKSTDVRFRLVANLHEALKDKAEKEERSMNYLMNKAVELLLSQENAKA
ncbi:toxin-antitoxin system HicB family antitoxin [Acinetobacter defluvii]|uniref:toxin-antitoxin system HicB family antitoxin n=1 Tax=Acinetobacter defluvii TaxID=1871111 RepID=UPI003AF59082